eukprot:NODE_20682_length_787_cov_2.237879.p3 GENE.NODE_20682_length_787_cov_2.237879~~NODE_20682_length_787_cov_2.237879.p3  ORF type:complete len:87 (-),score=10.37 NODE_20682_length_787_cov_2.237879:321-581(-)
MLAQRSRMGARETAICGHHVLARSVLHRSGLHHCPQPPPRCAGLGDIAAMGARSGRRVAADVGITSPDAAGAGDDCTEAMYVSRWS